MPSAPRIFVVDDEEVISRTLATILNLSGFRATAFTNPLHALESAAADTPDLLLSDVMMPELSGIDLAVQIKERHPGCKILLFSGQAATANLLQEASKDGHKFNVLSKPIHPDELLAEIRRNVP